MSEPPPPYDGTPTPGGEDDPPIDLRRVATAVRRNGPFIAAFAGLAALIVLVVSLASSDQYRATTRLANDPVPGEPVDVETADRRLATYGELVTAPSVLADAARQLPGEPLAALERDVTASFDPAVSMLDVAAIGNDPAEVAQAANAVADAFVAARDRVEGRLAIRARERLAAEIERLRALGAPRTTLESMRVRLSELAVTAATAGSGLRIVEHATAPTAPFAPRPFRSAVLAFLAALLIAVLAAVARDRVRPALPDAAMLSRLTGLPLLAAWPTAGGPSLWERGRRALSRDRRRTSTVDETVIEEAALQGAVRSALPPRGQRIVLVHGVDASDGAAQVAAGLARSLTWGGYATVLVRFARPDSRGPAPGDVRTTYCADLDEQLDELKGSEYRYVVVETPWVARGARLRPLAGRSAAAVLVARLGVATSADAAAARRMVEALGLRGLGLVVICSPGEVPEIVRTAPTAPLRPPPRPRAASQNGAHGDAVGATAGTPDP